MAFWTYYHKLDPFAIQFTETFGLRWYSLAYIFGALSVWFFAKRFIRKRRIDFPEDKIWDLITYGALGAVIGGRLGYCIFYNPDLLTDFSSSVSLLGARIPVWGVLKIYEGGMASHGGIIGGLVALYLFSRKYKVPFFSLLDLAVFGGGAGIFLGRIANFINGELYGRIIQGKALLAVKFPSEIILSWRRDAASYADRLISLKQVLPALKKAVPEEGAVIPSAIEWEMWVKSALEEPFYQSKVSHICHLIVQFSSSVAVEAALKPLLSLRHPSQLYQALCGGLFPFLIIWILWLKPRKAGLISLAWLMSYLVFRLISESFRMPDSHIGYQFLNLTRGQWLSLSGFLLAGAFAWAVYQKDTKGFSLKR